MRIALLFFIQLLSLYSVVNLGKAFASALATCFIESSQIGAFVIDNDSSKNHMLEELSHCYAIEAASGGRHSRSIRCL